MKKPQIVMLYTGKHFKGFGLAVDGEVIAQQIDARIEQEPACHGIAKLHVTFNINREQMENPLHVDVSTLRKDTVKAG
ncbi:hypothetical protein [Pectobacterium odoriferum]|uniref:hypothetical protein n=1 Tax=Pectobacterium odoriferum TaxID=78398 RepID=UPI0005C4DDF9|nr:hypothetical protein [Pectobacterium odoriferum]